MGAELQETPRGERIHIGIFGRTNAGKSTLVNLVSGGEVALVSPVKGTTTDPVYKAMELLPAGPVVFIDTPGLDDASEIGEKRILKTLEVIKKTDLAVLVVSSETDDLSFEKDTLQLFQKHGVPAVLVVNEKCGEKTPLKMSSDRTKVSVAENRFASLKLPYVKLCLAQETAQLPLRQFLLKHIPLQEEVSLVSGLVHEGDTVVLVMPQDIQAPKGRLILPQVQMLRSLLDEKCKALCTVPSQLADLLANLKGAPDLVITDSQVFREVNEILPATIPLTSFSVLLSKSKGDIHTLVAGARAIGRLKADDRVLIMEACSHHALKGDIARQKLPEMLQNYTGVPLSIEVYSGTGIPQNLAGYQLIVHCGGCMLNRKNMLSRMAVAKEAGVAMTNFGTAIAFVNGMLDRICY